MCTDPSNFGSDKISASSIGANQKFCFGEIEKTQFNILIIPTKLKWKELCFEKEEEKEVYMPNVSKVKNIKVMSIYW